MCNMLLEYKPKIGQEYWTVQMQGVNMHPAKKVYQLSAEDIAREMKGWVFASQKECQELCVELNRAFRIASKVFYSQRQRVSVCGLPS